MAAALKRKSKVVAAVELPGVPAGTTGTVILVDGIRWIRYWVRFDNGVELGSIDGSQLSTMKDWLAREKAATGR